MNITTYNSSTTFECKYKGGSEGGGERVVTGEGMMGSKGGGEGLISRKGGGEGLIGNKGGEDTQ